MSSAPQATTVVVPTLDKIEMGRLAVFQRTPWLYATRRVESLEMKDDRHYAVTVRQQITIPFHRPGESRVERDLLIPLGQFSKARRPDMRATAPDGLDLPVLHHDQRARVAAVMFVTSWQRKLIGSTARDAHEQLDAILAAWGIVQYMVEQVVKRPRDGAHKAIAELELILLQAKMSLNTPSDVKGLVDRINSTTTFWDELKHLAETTMRIAAFRGVPGKTYVITITYTERFHYAALVEPESFKGIPLAAVRYVLGRLGLDSIPVSRETANSRQARSLWVSHSVPEGLEPLRFFWQRELTDHPEAESIESDRAVVSRRTDAKNATDEPESLQLDFQVAPSASVFTAMALALLLWFIGVYIYQRVPPGQGERQLLAGIATALAGIPATLVGALAYRGQTFISRASLGPRLLLAGLSLLASLLAVVLGLKTGKGHEFLEFLAYALSIYALFTFGVFGYIRFGPRWRKSVRSRKPGKTKKLTPAQCRFRQTCMALLFCVVWVGVVVAFARIIYVLQLHHESVFSKHFPGNAWKALRPWLE